MAIVQISRIQQRRGLQQDLPQLASAELGWSLDTRRLFIGNGTTNEGAPAAGVTEILTQYSNILSVVQSYTYQGTASGYTVQTGSTALNPVLRSLQAKLDDIVTTRDFGTVGNSVADDTAALQRAIVQLYPATLNPGQPIVRRILRIPAGTYKISSAIVVPPNCSLIGEGKNNTIILQTTAGQPVFVTGDSNYQTGSAMGAAGATLPSNISIEKLTLKQSNDADVFVVDSARAVKLNSVNLTGSGTWVGGSSTTSGLKLLSTVADAQQIQIEDSAISSVATAANIYATTGNIRSVDFNNNYISTSYQGISVIGLASPGTPASVRAYNNMFNNIVTTGILGAATATGVSSVSNRYQNVGNGTGNSYGTDATPSNPVIVYYGPDCSSIGDVFDRSDASAVVQPRMSSLISYSMLPHAGVQLGSYQFTPGTKATLTDNQSSFANITALSSSMTGSISRGVVDYSVVRGTNTKYGRVEFATNGGTTSYDDEYTEVGSTGVTLQVASGALQYTSTSTGTAPSVSYSIRWLV
jgi:hypothetical protein